ncbi:MAG: WD40 repeat domain-containing protein [Planctomycetaceae bacterium]|jgi:WD40 repeat protein|nr:WD40 repeat domain-containing protein [Planctomycetaceae bacterium]MBT4723849.1 WD40 repeat domain-containing protein [Planctomycetaceae bacterium]MBT5124995.1 WD40 repeat domain-containing protein [Planctomycetaceae bacterium]MBT5599264.1 WD40 repeat domain-containing protein [Planctomycetaceae bacterium]MBT6849017.1 WD40 repeat domain-containing protein [Planctomycetaceae bacterium]
MIFCFKIRRFPSIIATIIGLLFAGQALPAEPTGRLVQNRQPVISSVCLQDAGDLMATAGDDHIVRIWNLKTGTQVHQLHGHNGWVRTAKFIGNSNILATAGDDGQVIRWDCVSGRQLDVLLTVDHAIWRIAINPQATHLAIGGFNSKVTVVDLADKQITQQHQHPTSDIRGLAYSTTGDRLACGGRDGMIRIWSTTTGELLATVAAHQRRIRDLSFIKSDSYLVSISDDRTLRVSPLAVDPTNKNLGYSIALEKQLPFALTVCGGAQVAIGSSDNQIHLWDIDAKQQTHVFQGHSGSVITLAFSPANDGRTGLLVSGSFDTSIRTWQIKTKAEEVIRVSKQSTANRK